jgi:hypothetical protein
MRLLAGLAVLAGLVVPAGADASQPCARFAVPCAFEAPGFVLTVVDAETRQPLPGVHALAEWQVQGTTPQPPLATIDAVSRADGLLVFAGWGPLREPVNGLAPGRDPVITFFKPGYRALVLEHVAPPDTTSTTRVRRFGAAGTTLALEPFRGTADQWVEELERASVRSWAISPSAIDVRRRAAYLRRLRLIAGEGVALGGGSHASFFDDVNRVLGTLQTGPR